MAEVKWIKIVTDIFDDEKILLIESMPDADAVIVIWFKLLCLAGRQNNSGVFLLNESIPYTDEMFATIFRRPLNTVRLALRTFEQFGMIEIINGTVTIPNWSKHQTLDKVERNREYMKNYMRRRREEQRLLTEGKTSGKTNSKANCKTNSKSNVSGADKDKEKDKEKDIDKDYSTGVNPFGDNNDERPDFNTVEAYASSNLKYMSANNMKELASFKEQLPDDLIIYAIDKAIGNGVRNYSYVRAILNSYVDSGIRTIGDAEAHEEKRKVSGMKNSEKNPALNYQQRDASEIDLNGFFLDLGEG